jgi:FkbM family methyltransferase
MQINRFTEINNKNISDREKTRLRTQKLIELENINKNSIVIDIGSNFGEVIDALLSTECEIHSFEPHPIFYNMIYEKYHQYNNVFLYEKAIWTSNTKKKLYYKRSETALNGGSTLIPEKTNIHNLNLFKEVDCIDIVEFLNKFKEVDLLKMDIEGAEYEILDKIFKTDTYKKIKSIYYEDHSSKIPTERYKDLKNKTFQNFNSKNIPLYSW